MTLRSLWAQFLRGWADYLEPLPPPSSDAILVAVKDACADVGLNASDVTAQTNLAQTGKLYAVLHHAAYRLGKDHELVTVGDVVDWLQEAPTA